MTDVNISDVLRKELGNTATGENPSQGDLGLEIMTNRAMGTLGEPSGRPLDHSPVWKDACMVGFPDASWKFGWALTKYSSQYHRAAPLAS